MNEDYKPRIFQQESSLMTLDDTDGSDADTRNCSSNILENFPYLKNDGLGQIQAQQSTGQNSRNNFAQINVETTGETVHSGKVDKAIKDESCSSTQSYLAHDDSAISMSSKCNVQFVLKGKLGHNMDTIVKSFKQMLIEPIDVEERLIVDYVYNYSREIKTEPFDEPTVSTSSSQKISGLVPSLKPCFPTPSQTFHEDTFESSSSVKGITSQSNTDAEYTVIDAKDMREVKDGEEKPVRYTEPSIADIRANLLGSFQCSQSLSNLNAESDITEKEMDEIEVKEEKQDEGWYDTSLKKIASNRRKSEEFVTNTPSANKGGRSDPVNPFALTSPSFNDSTAKALMTTTQTSTATIIMISIMSIGSRAKILPKIVNSKAAEGGLISIVNPIEPPFDKSTQLNNDEQISSERTSIMSKLRREKSMSSDDGKAAFMNIDRLDVNIKIDDDQYVGHGENKRWLCKICPKSYTTKHNLVAHILDHGDIKPHLCLVCEKYFKQLSHLNTHMLTHDNVKPYVCTLCDKGFTQISHLKRHETVHMGSKPYVCDICNRGFAFPSELRIHKDKHVSGSEKCTDCDKEFSSWTELQEHMVAFNHCGDLQCKHCDRIFRFPSQLRDHMTTHAGSRPYICTECGMDFMKEHHLKSHQFTHTGLRPYACPDCGRSFNQKANMQRHMLIHNAERAYMCEVCSKTFTQPQTLKAHMVVHSNTKPYICKLCGKQFGRQHNLQGHMHMHSDSKPYTCSICQACFTLKGNLNRHKKVKHNLDESTEVMEEDAVNFLSTISDRARENFFSQSDQEIDQDSQDGQSSPESRSNKKGRKSVPRKRFSSQLNDANVDEDIESDTEIEELITYSDEERENDRTNELKSKYFNVDSSKKESTRSTRKTVVAAADDDDDVKGDGSTDKNSPEFQQNDIDTSITNTMSEVRSTRKRKKKFYGDDFTETGLDIESPSRSQRKKTKLDKIIASKFST